MKTREHEVRERIRREAKTELKHLKERVCLQERELDEGKKEDRSKVYKTSERQVMDNGRTVILTGKLVKIDVKVLKG